MASTATHRAATSALIIPAFAVGLVVTFDPLLAASCAAGVAATLAVQPDLDLMATHEGGERRQSRLPLAWRWAWYGYADQLTHRHILSHFPIVGTVGRLVYIAVIVTLMQLAVFRQVRFTPPLDVAAAWAAGMAASDTIHWLLDRCPIRL